jgi:hypothetical protein
MTLGRTACFFLIWLVCDRAMVDLLPFWFWLVLRRQVWTGIEVVHPGRDPGAYFFG